MGTKIYKCKDCGNYTLEGACKVCKTATVVPGPARYTPKDPYGKYRRLAKKEEICRR